MSKPPTKPAKPKASPKATTKLKPVVAAARVPSVFKLGDVLRCRLTGTEGIAVKTDLATVNKTGSMNFKELSKRCVFSPFRALVHK